MAELPPGCKLPDMPKAMTLVDLPHIAIEDMHPLWVIHAIMAMRFNAGDYAGALFAAITPAPYTNARLSSSEVRVTHTLATLSDEELQAQALAYERKIAAANGEATIEGEAIHYWLKVTGRTGHFRPVMSPVSTKPDKTREWVLSRIIY